MTNTQPASRNYWTSIIIIGILFFIFGFVTWVNGSLIPYLKLACELETDLQAYLVLTAFYIAYTVMALPSSMVLSRTGYKRGMSIGLFIMAVGAAIFIPAAQTRDYYLFLTGLFIIATGLALLQTASNPYVAIIGPIDSAASRISIMGVCNKVAGIIVTVTFAYVALDGVDDIEKNIKLLSEGARAIELDKLASRMIMPYTIIAVILFVLAISILYSPLPDLREEDFDGQESGPSNRNNKTSIFQFPFLFLGVIAIFCYVGVEVMVGDTIINYGKSLGISMEIARYFTPIALGFMTIGYIFGIFAIPRLLSQQMALRVCAILGIFLTVGVVLLPGLWSIYSMFLLGLANSLMWPAIFPLGIDGLGKFTKTGSALLIMGIAGGAIIPQISAFIKGLITDLRFDYLTDGAVSSSVLYENMKYDSELFGSQQSYWLMLPCYLYILFFAVKGHKVGKA